MARIWPIKWLIGNPPKSYPAALLSMTLLGFGMAITVAPLTTSVLNAAPARRTGVASGINNAVASVGSLLVIALLGTLALGIFDRALERHLAQSGPPEAVAQVVKSAAGGLVIPPMPASLSLREQQSAHALIAAALEDTVAFALWIACVLALASALVAALSLAPRVSAAASSTA